VTAASRGPASSSQARGGDEATFVPDTSAPNIVAVWDLPLRVSHWTLAVSVPLAWLTANIFDTVHEIAGYTALGVVAFRIVWGFAGSRYARFAHFLRRPVTVARYLWRLVTRGRTGRYIGHNPAGAAMAVALLLLTAISCISGWMQITERWFGVEWVERLHAWSSHAVLVFAVVHVLAVLLMCVLQRENLVMAMITGRKRLRR
jgi:cytochrome b